MTQGFAGNLVKYGAALAYAISAVLLALAFVLGSYDTWWYGPSLVSGLVFFFLATCVISGWLAYLGLKGKVSDVEASKRLLYRDKLKGFIGIGTIVAFIVLQASAVYNEVRSFERSFPDIDPRIESAVWNTEAVDLADTKQKRLHQFYADAVYVRFGKLHNVTDISGEIVEFYPDLILIETREAYLRSKLNATLVVSALSLGFILCFLSLVFWVLCWRFAGAER